MKMDMEFLMKISIKTIKIYYYYNLNKIKLN